MDEKELRQLAVDIVDGKVMGSWNVNDPNMIPMVFMPLSLMTKKARASLKRKKTVHVYEYISEAGPRGINGYPMFFSMRIINKENWEKLAPLVKEIQAQKEKFLEG